MTSKHKTEFSLQPLGESEQNVKLELMLMGPNQNRKMASIDVDIKT
jgi:hypothetical protein